MGVMNRKVDRKVRVEKVKMQSELEGVSFETEHRDLRQILAFRCL